ncbi:SMC family ATPase [Cellulosimicrobium terreum]|nr:SMC family ATPase [Cellulosimicrobium terreum]
MHLHSVTFQAIGPFPGRHRIDLATLGAGGIFLLDGPTGAGKSTIIDAVVFALYGKVAAAGASDDRLRSAFAPPDVESFVDLVLEVPAGVFRIRRTPEYRRPKKRGAGTTTQQASVRLWRLPAVPAATDEDPAGELVSARLDEVGVEVERVVGLDRRQLVQTVVLPQGEFASFLRADPEKRRDLLQKVFGTELYERASARLAEMARDARARIETARQSVQAAVEHVVGAAGFTAADASELRGAAQDETRLRRCAAGDLESEVEVEVEVEAEAEAGTAAGVEPGVHALALAHERRRRAEADELALHELAANGLLVAARDRLDAERATAAALEKRAVLGAERARLAAEEPHVAGLRDRLDAAARAAVVAPAARRARAADVALADALERQELARTGAPDVLATADPSTLEALRSDVVAASVRVARLLPVGAELPARERELADGRKEVARAEEGRRRVQTELAGRPAVRDALHQVVEDHRETAGSLGELQGRALRARSVATAAQDAEETALALARAVDARGQAATVARAAVDAERDVRAARIAGIAGELADGLLDAEPCPVCGSSEHPQPATRTRDHATPQDVDAAEAARVEADAALHQASGLVRTLTERVDALRHAAEGLDARSAHDRVTEVTDAVRTAEEAGARLAEALRGLEEHDTVTRELQGRDAGLAQTVAAETSRLDALAEHVAADRAEIRRESASALVAAGGHDVASGARNPVAVLVAALEARLRSIDALVAAQTAVATARRDAEQRGTELGALLTEGGFADAGSALASVLDENARAQAERDVSRYGADLVMLRAGLADPAVAGLTEDATADVDAARRAVTEAEDAMRVVTRRHELVARQADAARSGADAVGTAIDGWVRARADAGPVHRMAALAAGTGSDNVHALSLATFVLVRRFEDVVAAANERLAEMSSGRYELVRSTTREDVRSRRTGLAMKVLDHVTEQSRDPRTLSGGETFYVSLCLALGLADVVTAEAGGIELGTLFVDEGFGSLDPETLEVVLAELGRLRAGGRAVGIVSHVEALKQSIAERVEVRRLPGGGSTLTVRA